MADKQSEEITVQENKQLPDIEISEVTIKNLIYVVWGQQVMMDSDLAMLYQVETRVLKAPISIPCANRYHLKWLSKKYIHHVTGKMQHFSDNV